MGLFPRQDDFKKLMKLDMALLSYSESMAMDTTANKNLSVAEARNNFSQFPLCGKNDFCATIFALIIDLIMLEYLVVSCYHS